MGIKTHSSCPTDLVTVEAASATSDPQKNSFVYQRRKRHKQCHTVRSHGVLELSSSGKQEQDHVAIHHVVDVSGRSVAGSSINGVHNGQQNLFTIVPFAQSNSARILETSSKSNSYSECSGVEVLNCNAKKSLSDLYSSADDSCCSAKSNMAENVSSLIRNEFGDGGMCSSSIVIVAEFFKRNLLDEVCTSNQPCLQMNETRSMEESSMNHFQTCKVCGLLDDRLKLLICDLCEEAFHLSCCNPPMKSLSIDEWYCMLCSEKNPKSLLEITKKGDAKVCTYRHKLRGGSTLISFMLNGARSYNSGVRIGKAFQADVHEWTGPVSDDTDCLGEPEEIDPSECAKLDGWHTNTYYKHNTISNWIQCQAVIYSNPRDGQKGVICGKWRRAPLFEVQTDDWDCSCSVLWDPAHADCAVPQELGTKEVMMHLKYIEMLRHRLASKKEKLF